MGYLIFPILGTLIPHTHYTHISGWWLQTFFIFHFIYGIKSDNPIPSDELIFSSWLSHHQPANKYVIFMRKTLINHQIINGLWGSRNPLDGGVKSCTNQGNYWKLRNTVNNGYNNGIHHLPTGAGFCHHLKYDILDGSLFLSIILGVWWIASILCIALLQYIPKYSHMWCCIGNPG